MIDPTAARGAVIDRLRAAGCVFAEEEAQILIESASSSTELEDLVGRRVAGLPLEHVVGWAEFCGLRIVVAEGVFVPRRRTEFLVEQALTLTRPGAIVVDLCCGSGAVGAAVSASVADIELHATDIEPAAVRCARRNLTGASVYQGDLDAPLPNRLRGRVDVLIANAPYEPTAELRLLPREARIHEPTVTLDGGADGVRIQARVAAVAGSWLAPGGHLLIETSQEQAEATLALFVAAGLRAHVVSDVDREATVVIGELRNSGGLDDVAATFSRS